MYIQDVAQKVGVHKNTLYRWFKERRIKEVPRDIRGWRIFLERDVNRIKEHMNKVIKPKS